MRIGGFDFDAVMPCTRSDKKVRRGRRFAGLPATARKFTRVEPNFIVDPEVGNVMLKVGEHFALLLVPYPGPQLQTDHGAPGSLSILHEATNSAANLVVSRPTQRVNPR